MQLWDDCLDDMVMEDTQKEVEIKFAKKILDILPGIEYKEENEELIIQLYAHYPLYKYAGQFVDKGWQLFNHARHPFVQSVGSSIVYKCGESEQSELMEVIKTRIDEFEKIGNKSETQLLDFIYQNNNSFVLLIAGRKNLRDFNFALAKLKSQDFFIIYLNLLDILHLQRLFEAIDYSELTCLLHILSRVDRLFLLDFEHHQNIRYLLRLRNHEYSLYLTELKYFQELENILDLLNLKDLKGLDDLIDFKNFRYLPNLRGERDQYQKKYAYTLKKNKKKIDDWADKAIAKLHAMSDKELLKYFPGTSQEDLKIFRESNEGKA